MRMAGVWLLTLFVALVMPVSILSQGVPPTPTGVTIQSLGSLVIEFKWQATSGDFDNYEAVYYDVYGYELRSDAIPKNETSYRYLVIDGVAEYSFHTVKGNNQSASADLQKLPPIIYNIQLPHASFGSPTHHSITISWSDAPDPINNVGQYVISLQQPVGTTIDQATIDAVAGATHTFQGLNVAQEYRLRVDAVLTDGLPVEVNVFEDTYTVPYPPTNGLLHRTSSTTGTLTWVGAQAPVGYYEVVITPVGVEPRVYTYPPESTGIVIDWLENGVTYSFTLKNVVNTGSREIKSNSAIITLIFPAPTGLNLGLQAITDHGMHLSWTPSTTQGLQGYRITVLETAGNKAVGNDIPPTDTSFTQVGLAQGTGYEFILDEIINGVWLYVGMTTGTTKRPMNVHLQGATAYSITISWNTTLGASAEGYLVSVISQDGSYTALITVNVASAAAPFMITELSAGQTYEVGVDAVVAGARQEVGALTDPANTTATVAFDYQLSTTPVTLTTMDVAWQHNFDAGFENYLLTVTKTKNNTQQTFIVSATVNPGQAVTGLTPGTAYSVEVSGLTGGIPLVVSTAEQSTVPEPPSLTIMEQNSSDKTVTLSWFQPKNGAAENYIIRYGPYGSVILQQVVLAPTESNYTLPVLDDNQQYTVQIFSSIGPNQELISDMGVITPSGGFTTVINPVNAGCTPINPCRNDGLCSDDPPGDVTCMCTVGWIGLYCEVHAKCTPNPCRNGGTCMYLTGNVTCDCTMGWTGNRCETYALCSPNPCQNGGMCVPPRPEDMTNMYQCTCEAGYIGSNCEDDVCSPNPCLSSGLCSRDDSGNMYKCMCLPGSTGGNCENNACSPNPCLNGGMCNRDDSGNMYNCMCRQGYSGGDCQNSVDNCMPNPCQNGGMCTSQSGNNYNCMCQNGATGNNCQNAAVNTTLILIIVVAVVVVLLVVVLVIVVVCIVRRSRRKRRGGRSSSVDNRRGQELVEKKKSNTYGIDDRQASTTKTNGRCDEFPRDKLHILGQVGSGSFAVVYKAQAEGISRRGTTTTVAVKMLKESATPNDQSDFKKELQLYSMLDQHSNVLSMLGCCTDKDPMYIILEYVPHGNLQTYLRHIRTGTEPTYMNKEGFKEKKMLTPSEILTFASQVVRGMEYLASKQCIHRDLATRNILLGEGLVCKVADFGLARDLAEQNQYEMKSQGRVPVRWMAPESLISNMYTTKSDVWSFGVLLWELVTLGSHPYPGMSSQKVINELKKGYRLPKPEHCSDDIYAVMMDCWQERPQDRPTFARLHITIDDILADATGYLEMSNLNQEDYVYLKPGQDSDSDESAE